MEHAGFALDDAPALVEASLSCPLCLHAVDWSPSRLGAAALVACRCRSCGDERTVELSGVQMLRLAVLDEDQRVLNFMG